MSTQKLRDLLSTATHAVGQAEAEAYKGIGFNRDGDFPALRDEIKRITAERDSLRRSYTPGKVQELEQERSTLLNRLVGVDGLRDSLRAMTQKRNELQRDLDNRTEDRNAAMRTLADVRVRLDALRLEKGGSFIRVVKERDELQREVDGLHTICGEQRDEFQDMLHRRDDLSRQLAAAERLAIAEAARLRTHLHAARKERDHLLGECETLTSQLGTAQRDLKQGRPTYRKLALRMKRERDALNREVGQLLKEDERQQLALCKQHRDALQEQVGSVEGHRDALLHDVDMLEVQVRSRDNAIADLMADTHSCVSEFVRALRETADSLEHTEE